MTEKTVRDIDPLELGKDCERMFCEDKQTTQEGANYGMCAGHYKGSLWACDECLSDEGNWCQHKEKADL